MAAGYERRVKDTGLKAQLICDDVSDNAQLAKKKSLEFSKLQWVGGFEKGHFPKKKKKIGSQNA